MKKLIAVIGVTLLAGLCSQAQAADHKMTASFLPGVSVPVGGLYACNTTIDRSVNGGVGASFATAIAVDYQLKDSLAVGLEIGRDWNHSPKQFSSNYSGNEISLLQITPYAKYSFQQIGKVTPYGVFGVGMYSFHQKAEAIDGSEYYGARTLNYLGFNIGGGATYALSKGLELGLDVRWHHVFSNVQMEDLSDGSSSLSALNNFTPSVKVQYNFSI